MEDSEEESPARTIFECVAFLVRKRLMLPLQKLKALILFSDDEESIEVSNRIMPYELNMFDLYLSNVCTLVKQRFLLDAFLSMKNRYLLRSRMEKAYLSIRNLNRLSESVLSIQKEQREYLNWLGFGAIYDHWYGLKFSMSQIEAKPDYYNHNASRDLEEFVMGHQQTQTQQIEYGS